MNIKINNSVISQKTITDKKNGNISHFVVLALPSFEKQDWISFKKLIDISVSMVKLPLEYPLKSTIKGNPDEGRKGQDGKALKLSITGEDYLVDIYSQKFGENWTQSHTHTIKKSIFDAYTLVVKNDSEVAELEKESKSLENFSLGLS